MTGNEDVVYAIQRMSTLLALVAVKDLDDKESVLTLLRAGYTQLEVASLLGKKRSAVSMIAIRHEAKADVEKAAKKSPRVPASNGHGKWNRKVKDE
jgi:hypothetical protein